MSAYRCLALCSLLLALFGAVAARAAPQLGYRTVALDPDARRYRALHASGHLAAYLTDSRLIVRDLRSGAPILDTPLADAPPVPGAFALDERQVAWVGADNRIALVNLADNTRESVELDRGWQIHGLALAREWYIVAWNYRHERMTIEAINRRTAERRVIARDADRPGVQARGDHVVWYGPGDGAAVLMAHDLSAQTTSRIDPLALGTAPALDGDWVAYAGADERPRVVNLADGRRETYPFDARYVKLAGDFLVLGPEVANWRGLAVVQRSTGASRVITRETVDSDWSYTVTPWAITLAPEPTVVWFRTTELRPRDRVAGLFATTITPVTPPAAMEPEAPTPDGEYFAQTGHNLDEPFRGYWRRNGGLDRFGYPLSSRFEEVNADTQATYPTQYLERQRFEWHAEARGTPYEVALGRLGAELLEAQGRDWRREGHDQDWATQLPGECAFFDVTQRSVCGPFLDYWRGYGLDLGQPGVTYAESLALFGLPLTAPRVEANPDGARVLTQWFERARFEWHPDNPAPYAVQLGRLGAELLAVRGWRP